MAETGLAVVSRLTLLVQPEDAVVEIEGIPIGQTGGVRRVQTPGLQPGRRYQYRITARWSNGSYCQRDVTFEAGEELVITLTPDPPPSGYQPADSESKTSPACKPSPEGTSVANELLNFGLDVPRLQDRRGREPGQERFIWRGREISRVEAEALLAGLPLDRTASSGARLPDDSHLPHLTIVSRDPEVRRRIVRDLASAPELAEVRTRYRVQSYPADHWIVPRLKLDQDAEFAATGLAILVQPPAGSSGTSPARICYRYQGPQALAAWLANETRPPFGLKLPVWVYLVLALLVGSWIGHKRTAQPFSPSRQGRSTMSILQGYKTYIAALLAAFVAFNHVVPVVAPEVEQALLAAATALGLYGLRHALERLELANSQRQSN